MEIKLTAIVIAKNEEKMLFECLKSLRWADEILVIDTGSTDKTIEMAKKAKVTVAHSSGKTFSEWRIDGLKKAMGEWVLYIDADERVTPALQEEIIKIINSASHLNAYAIPRINVILGKELIHGGWYPDYVKRLFSKNALKGWRGDLHEEPEYKGGMGHLKNPMKHIKHETFTEMIEKTNNWSDIEAKLMYDANHPPMNIPRFFTAMWREFFLRMIKKMAFLDGAEGIMFAMYQVYSRFISYAKLWELQEQERMIKT